MPVIEQWCRYANGSLAELMQFTAEQYYRVSLERMKQARDLYRDGTAYSLAMYCGGLAVESLLRAFRWTQRASFEGRHDLSELLKASRLLRVDDEYLRRRGESEEAIRQSGVALRGAMNEVIILWHNNLWYASEGSLKAFLNKLGRVQGVRGGSTEKERPGPAQCGTGGGEPWSNTMDLKDKIVGALSAALKPEYVRLDDDDGISGFVVSRRFKGMSTLDRQGKIEEVLEKAPLAPKERRQILMIAGLTPDEYEAVGARIRVHRVKELGGGAVEVLVHGGLSDAEYVRGALKNEKGIQTTEPKRASGAIGVLTAFEARGSETTPLTKAKATQILKKDQYIEVMPNA